ncbi:hypothetical protein Pmani_009673 [Petrolisthes manimaculis]|uniref:Sodium/potassium-transporting ATPase subunit beta-2 n=1 Tax=Petrolisthes manimaculis TaxID=1843537 RepID=A0AAE1Q4H7_9EUCA|nr:hypothetical protein Pmani_009673 [Petrolisthes manimaculis]
MASSSNRPPNTTDNYPSTIRLPPGKQSFTTYLWNPQNNSILGRTGTSWAKITIFYVIFYLFLAGFFSLLGAVFYQTISYDLPTYTGEASILKHPGLGFRPLVKELVDKKYILSYDPSDNKTTTGFVNNINKFLERYNNQSVSTHRPCTWNEKKSNERNEKQCLVIWRSINTTCNPNNNWGYHSTSPCIILKMNKMIDYKPIPLKDLADLPTSLQAHINQTVAPKDAMAKNVWVWCESQNKDVVLEQRSPGIPIYYYPYNNQPGYLSPIVIVRVHLKADVTTIVTCKVWGEKITHKSNRRLTGMADFSITAANTKTQKTAEL